MLKDIIPITPEYALCLATDYDSIFIQVGGSKIPAKVIQTNDFIIGKITNGTDSGKMF